MANTDLILELLEFINPEAYYDDCLSSELGIDQIPLIFRKQVRVLTNACFRVFPECKKTGHRAHRNAPRVCCAKTNSLVK